MDFVADELANRNRFRYLTIVDVFTGESLAIEVGQRLSGTDVASVLNRLRQAGRVRVPLYCDNGSEFTSQILDLWAYHNKVSIEFSRPGKPTDNAFIESFNGTFRDERLNAHWFQSLKDARMQITAWQKEYNECRPHRALGEVAPAEFARQHRLKGKLAAENRAGDKLWSWLQNPGPIMNWKTNLITGFKLPYYVSAMPHKVIIACVCNKTIIRGSIATNV